MSDDQQKVVANPQFERSKNSLFGQLNKVVAQVCGESGGAPERQEISQEQMIARLKSSHPFWHRALSFLGFDTELTKKINGAKQAVREIYPAIDNISVDENLDSNMYAVQLNQVKAKCFNCGSEHFYKIGSYAGFISSRVLADQKRTAAEQKEVARKITGYQRTVSEVASKLEINSAADVDDFGRSVADALGVQLDHQKTPQGPRASSVHFSGPAVDTVREQKEYLASLIGAREKIEYTGFGHKMVGVVNGDSDEKAAGRKLMAALQSGTSRSEELEKLINNYQGYFKSTDTTHNTKELRAAFQLFKNGEMSGSWRVSDQQKQQDAKNKVAMSAEKLKCDLLEQYAEAYCQKNGVTYSRTNLSLEQKYKEIVAHQSQLKSNVNTTLEQAAVSNKEMTPAMNTAMEVIEDEVSTLEGVDPDLKANLKALANYLAKKIHVEHENPERNSNYQLAYNALMGALTSLMTGEPVDFSAYKKASVLWKRDDHYTKLSQALPDGYPAQNLNADQIAKVASFQKTLHGGVVNIQDIELQLDQPVTLSNQIAYRAEIIAGGKGKLNSKKRDEVARMMTLELTRSDGKDPGALSAKVLVDWFRTDRASKVPKGGDSVLESLSAQLSTIDKVSSESDQDRLSKLQEVSRLLSELDALPVGNRQSFKRLLGEVRGALPELSQLEFQVENVASMEDVKSVDSVAKVVTFADESAAVEQRVGNDDEVLPDNEEPIVIGRESIQLIGESQYNEEPIVLDRDSIRLRGKSLELEVEQTGGRLSEAVPVNSSDRAQVIGQVKAESTEQYHEPKDEMARRGTENILQYYRKQSKDLFGALSKDRSKVRKAAGGCLLQGSSYDPNAVSMAARVGGLAGGYLDVKGGELSSVQRQWLESVVSIIKDHQMDGEAIVQKVSELNRRIDKAEFGGLRDSFKKLIEVLKTEFGDNGADPAFMGFDNLAASARSQVVRDPFKEAMAQRVHPESKNAPVSQSDKGLDALMRYGKF